MQRRKVECSICVGSNGFWISSCLHQRYCHPTQPNFTTWFSLRNWLLNSSYHIIHQEYPTQNLHMQASLPSIWHVLRTLSAHVILACAVYTIIHPTLVWRHASIRTHVRTLWQIQTADFRNQYHIFCLPSSIPIKSTKLIRNWMKVLQKKVQQSLERPPDMNEEVPSKWRRQFKTKPLNWSEANWNFQVVSMTFSHMFSVKFIAIEIDCISCLVFFLFVMCLLTFFNIFLTPLVVIGISRRSWAYSDRLLYE